MNEPQHLLGAVACGYEALPVRSRAPHLPRHSVEMWPELPRFVHISPFGRICANRDHLVILSGRHFSLTSKTIRAFPVAVKRGARRDLEHKAGIEPACSRFADDCLTTWLLMQTHLFRILVSLQYFSRPFQKLAFFQKFSTDSNL